MQTRDEVEGLHNSREFFQPLECLYQAIQTRTGRKDFYCFYKLIRQMKEIMFIDFLTIISPTNQSKRTTDNARAN